jgi:hypothetical protein
MMQLPTWPPFRLSAPRRSPWRPGSRAFCSPSGVLMRQLAGSTCVICRKSVDSVVVGRFCPGCDRPVHNDCIYPPPPLEADGKCPVCGADERHIITAEPRETSINSERSLRQAFAVPKKETELWRCAQCGVTNETLLCNYCKAPAPAKVKGARNALTSAVVWYHCIRWFIGGLCVIVLGIFLISSPDMRANPKRIELADLMPGIGAILVGIVIIVLPVVLLLRRRPRPASTDQKQVRQSG